MFVQKAQKMCFVYLFDKLCFRVVHPTLENAISQEHMEEMS